MEKTVTGLSASPYKEILREQVRALLGSQRVPLPAYFSESRDERLSRARDGFVDVEQRARCGTCAGRGCRRCQLGRVTVVHRDPYRVAAATQSKPAPVDPGSDRMSALRLSYWAIEDALSRLPRGLQDDAKIHWLADNVPTPLAIPRKEWESRKGVFAPLIRRAWVEEPQNASALAHKIGATKNYVRRALRATESATESAARRRVSHQAPAELIPGVTA